MARRAPGSEGTAYIDKEGGRWTVRWWSQDEQRYYTVKKTSTLEEAKRWAKREGMKVVVAEPHNLGARKLSGKQDWSPKGRKPGEPIWPEFVDAYLEAALWASSVGDDEKPLDDQGYTIHDFSKKAIAQAVEESNDFITANRSLLESVGTQEQHGHDFWLTRNHHGAGFWDRGYGAVGEKLSEAAHAYGEQNAYVGDDRKVHLE